MAKRSIWRRASWSGERKTWPAIYHVHCVLDKLLLDRADEQPEDVLDGEEDDDKVVDEVDDGHDDREVALPLLVLLQLLDGGEHEGDGGHEHHRQGEKGHKLSKSDKE